jgi:hypothetical protein
MSRALESAAAGNASGFKAVADGLLAAVRAGSVPAHIAHPQAELAARLAAVAGDETNKIDLLRVIALRVDDALEADDFDLVDALTAEGIAILTDLADSGNESAAVWLNGTVAVADIDAVRAAEWIDGSVIRVRGLVDPSPPFPDNRSFGEILGDALTQGG